MHARVRSRRSVVHWQALDLGLLDSFSFQCSHFDFLALLPLWRRTLQAACTSVEERLRKWPEMQPHNQAVDRSAGLQAYYLLRKDEAALSHQTVGFKGAALQFENEARATTQAEVSRRRAALFSDFFKLVFIHMNRTRDKMCQLTSLQQVATQAEHRFTNEIAQIISEAEHVINEMKKERSEFTLERAQQQEHLRSQSGSEIHKLK